jgi:hypothetical protein
MSHLTAGTYNATPTGEASVYENEKGNLILCMEMNCEGELLRYYSALATADNGLNIRQIETLKAVFGWDGVDFFWFVDHAEELKAVNCEVVLEMRPGRDGDRMFPSIKYLNGPGTSAELPQAGDRQSLLAKYGSKFRAVAGGTPSAPKPPAPKAPPKAPAPTVKPSDQMTVWGRYCELGGQEDQWFKTLAEAVPGVDQGDFTPNQWGQALDWIEKNTLPY